MAEQQPDGPVIMDRDAFYAWAEQQPRGKFERQDGRIFAMGRERASHVRAKLATVVSLRDAIAAAGADCEALTDGVAIRIGEASDYLPDASVNCGPRMDDDAIAVPNPIIAVEVISPSSTRIDSVSKLTGYMGVPSIRHYLIVSLDPRIIIHHRKRQEDDGIETRLVSIGPITLDPPGITVQAEDLFG